MAPTPLDRLSDLEFAVAARHIRKLVSDTNQAMARCGPHAGWASLIQRLEEVMNDYATEQARRADAPSRPDCA